MTEVATAFMFARREETPASREVASGIGAAEVNEARRDETASASEVGSALAKELRSATTDEMAATAEVSLAMAATADVASPITEETAANWLGSSEMTAERAAVGVATVASPVASATMDDTIPGIEFTALAPRARSEVAAPASEVMTSAKDTAEETAAAADENAEA
jgi:hypothetical protein